MGHTLVCEGVCFAYHEAIREVVWKKWRIDGRMWMCHCDGVRGMKAVGQEQIQMRITAEP